MSRRTCVRNFRMRDDHNAIEILNALRDRALADHRAREALPVLDSQAVGAASLDRLDLPELRP